MGAFALVAGTTEARADYIPSNAPYTKPANDVPWGAKLSSPTSSWWNQDSWWNSSTPHVPGQSYPSAWQDGQRIIIRAQTASRVLPALRALGTIGLGITAFDIGWKIGTATYMHFLAPASPTTGGLTSGWAWVWGSGGSGGFPSNYCPGGGVNVSGDGMCWMISGGASGIGTRVRFIPAGAADAATYPVAPGALANLNALKNQAPTITGAVPFPAANGRTVSAEYSSVTPTATNNAVVVTYTQTDDGLSQAMNLRPFSASEYNALPAAQQKTTAYTPPTLTSADLNAARAVLGNPVAGRDGSGNWVDGSGNVLTPGQVIAQTDANCSLDASYCSGGANDPAAPGAPLNDVAVMPSCTGAVVAVCTGLLDAAGFSGARTFTTLDLDGANVTLPAGSVVTQDHSAGASVVKTLPLTFTINPGLADMPLVLPAPLISETHPAYLLRLQTLGYVGTMTSTDLSEVTGNLALGPNTIVRLRVGTTTAPFIETPAFPSTPLRIRKDAPIQVQSNPSTFTPVEGEGTPVGGGTGTGSGCDCTIRAINWAPLMGLSAGDRFPFGLWTWLSGGISGWASSSSGAPAFDVPLYGIGSGKQAHVDLAPLGAIAALWRAALTVLVTVLAIWNFASRQAGDGDGEGL